VREVLLRLLRRHSFPQWLGHPCPRSGRAVIVLAVLAAGLVLAPGAASDPAISFEHHVSGTLGANGWYTSNVHIYWTFDPPPDQTSGCDARTITSQGHTHVVCTAWWAQTRLDDPLDIYIDKTAPAVSGAASRPPDVNGWYNHPLTVSFSGSDGTSGVAGCSSAAYGGPDNGNAAVSGTCTDNAGNVGTAAFSFKYDATPPTLEKVTVKHQNRAVLLHWTASPDAQLTDIQRSGPKGTTDVYRGPGKAYRDKGLRAGAKYRYTVTVFDEASNPASTTVNVTATGALLSPVPGERVAKPPLLVWTPVRGASYYNVQLLRGGRILSAWPRQARLKLHRTWMYKGHRYRLHRGLYQWYVWPGFGPLAAGHYGRRVGGSTFVYAP
jgi:hypothetical protein